MGLENKMCRKKAYKSPAMLVKNTYQNTVKLFAHQCSQGHDAVLSVIQVDIISLRNCEVYGNSSIQKKNVKNDPDLVKLWEHSIFIFF